MTTVSSSHNRTLYGCPLWCTFDHAEGPHLDAGSHERRLSVLPNGDGVDLLVARSAVPRAALWIGDQTTDLPATRETVEHLRDLSRMLRDAADELAELHQSGELEADA